MLASASYLDLKNLRDLKDLHIHAGIWIIAT